MKHVILAAGAAALFAAAAPAQESDAPQFMHDTFPEQGVSAAWAEFQAISGPDAALEPRVTELIGLAVAAQIPCDLCVYYHEKAARAAGADDAQIKQAVAAAALTRQWSTMLQGSAYDMDAWQGQVDAMFAE